MLCVWILPVSLPAYEFKGSFDQSIDCSMFCFVLFLDSSTILCFCLCSVSFHPQISQSESREVREVVVQGGDV